MTLDLSKTPVVKRGVKSAFSKPESVEEIYSELAAMGVPLETSPEQQAQPPDLTKYSDLDTITTQQLGALHIQYAGYVAFLSTKLAEIRVLEDASKRDLDALVSAQSVDLISKGVPKQELMHRIRGTPDFQNKELRYFKYSAMHKLLQARVTGYEAQAAAVSRMITIRTTDQETGLRDSRLASRGRKTHFSGPLNGRR